MTALRYRVQRATAAIEKVSLLWRYGSCHTQFDQWFDWLRYGQSRGLDYCRRKPVPLKAAVQNMFLS